MEIRQHEAVECQLGDKTGEGLFFSPFIQDISGGLSTDSITLNPESLVCNYR